MQRSRLKKPWFFRKKLKKQKSNFTGTKKTRKCRERKQAFSNRHFFSFFRMQSIRLAAYIPTCP